ncbi:unnamed protein product [marine sediment metagenome]|uniref:Uncharacterized protein n=1 Tax=marine sediment metagenome TaxID=412755 RepID=X0U5W5_9ZZZZ
MIPPGLFYHGHDYRDYPHGGESMPWDCDLELEVGDTVVHTFMERADIVNIEVEDEPGELYRMIPYDDIYVAKRRVTNVDFDGQGWDHVNLWNWIHAPKRYIKGDNGEIFRVIPLNGYSLCEEVKKEKPSKLIETVEEKDIDQRVGKVAYVGKPNRVYRVGGAGGLDLDGGAEIHPGDIIIKRRGDIHIRLEEDLHNRFFDTPVMYFIIQRKDIMGVKG